MLAGTPLIADSRVFMPTHRSRRPSHRGGLGIAHIVTEKWPEMLVALGFLMTWTAIAFSDF